MCEDLAGPLCRRGRGRAGDPLLAAALDARRTSAEVEQRVVELRRAASVAGPDWIGAELGVPARTVSRILARHQVPHLATLDPITGE